VRKGDKLTYVDAIAVHGMSLQDVVNFAYGPVGTFVAVSILSVYVFVTCECTRDVNVSVHEKRVHVRGFSERVIRYLLDMIGTLSQ
jgi:hypothetical protein